MNVAPAWQKGYTGKGVVVSILDDGIQTNHPDLAQNYVSILPTTHFIVESTFRRLFRPLYQYNWCDSRRCAVHICQRRTRVFFLTLEGTNE